MMSETKVRRPKYGYAEMVSYDDPDVAKVYSAEDDVRTVLDGYENTQPLQKHFRSLSEVQDYVDDVLSLDWVRERFPQQSRIRIRVVQSRHDRVCGMREDGVLSVPQGCRCGNAKCMTWALCETVILHEIAHWLEWTYFDGHGRAWREIYLELLERVVTPVIADVQRRAYQLYGLPTSEFVLAKAA